MKYLNLKDPKVHAEILAFITDEMAENSDLEGDEDPDDALPDQTTPNDISFQDMEESFRSCSDDDSLPCEVTENPVIMDEEDHPDESDLEAFDITWEKKLTPPKSFSSYQFCQNYGNAVTVDSDAPHLIFSLFFTSTFMNLIVEQSNLYASQHHANLDLTIEELKAFFGLLIVMGFNKLPSLRLYWSKDLNFASQRIMDVMPLKRFLKILRFLHLNDNTRMPLKGQFGYDKLYKVRPLFEQLNTTFHHAFNPSRCISIDESMVKFKGRSSLKQYMPLKPIKRGFKVWVAACANTGYCLSMSVYTGKEEKAGTSKMSLGEQVVSQLTHLFKGKGYCLFFDNFFSNVSMMSSLLQQNFFCCGTIQQRRKFFPKSYLMDDKQMKTGDSDFACSEEISVVKWRDRGKKSVCVISTMHDPNVTSSVLRTNKQGARERVQCPVAIKDYNQYMGGVDRFDQFMAAYSLSWKSRRWWLKLFYYGLDAAIVNSYIVYKVSLSGSSNSTKPISHLNFRSILANELIGSFCSRQKVGPSPSSGFARKRNFPDGRPTVHNTKRLCNVGDHLPKKGPTYRRCAHCSTKAKQVRSQTICVKCDVALCIDCFIPFHKSH